VKKLRHFNWIMFLAMLALTGIGTLAILLAPVLTKATERLWDALGGEGAVDAQPIDRAWEWKGGTAVTPLETSLFPRIEQGE
jgi:methionyl-tRNA synthetase